MHSIGQTIRVQDTFPNVAIALRMYLVLMVTNCSAERSFSKLKQVAESPEIEYCSSCGYGRTPPYWRQTTTPAITLVTSTPVLSLSHFRTRSAEVLPRRDVNVEGDWCRPKPCIYRLTAYPTVNHVSPLWRDSLFPPITYLPAHPHGCLANQVSMQQRSARAFILEMLEPDKLHYRNHHNLWRNNIYTKVISAYQCAQVW